MEKEAKIMVEVTREQADAEKAAFKWAIQYFNKKGHLKDFLDRFEKAIKRNYKVLHPVQVNRLVRSFTPATFDEVLTSLEKIRAHYDYRRQDNIGTEERRILGQAANTIRRAKL